MKHIVKTQAPLRFTQWLNAKRPQGGKPYFAQLNQPRLRAVKQKLKKALMQDQKGICCYCECTLQIYDSHIEHIQPQSVFPYLDLDYANLLCSCQNKIPAGDPRHCGMGKDNWYDAQLFVSPLDPSCESRFVFLVGGEIKPAQVSDIAAQTTIDNLCLDIPKLRASRKAIIDVFLDPSLSAEDVKTLASNYLAPNSQGNFNEYWTTVKYLFAV